MMGIAISLVGWVLFIIGIIAIFKPLEKLKIHNRKVAAAVLAGGFIVATIGGAMMSANDQEEQAAANKSEQQQAKFKKAMEIFDSMIKADAYAEDVYLKLEKYLDVIRQFDKGMYDELKKIGSEIAAEKKAGEERTTAEKKAEKGNMQKLQTIAILTDIAECSGFFVGFSTALSGDSERGMENAAKKYISAATKMAASLAGDALQEMISQRAVKGRNQAVSLIQRQDIESLKTRVAECNRYQMRVTTAM